MVPFISSIHLWASFLIGGLSCSGFWQDGGQRFCQLMTNMRVFWVAKFCQCLSSIIQSYDVIIYPRIYKNYNHCKILYFGKIVTQLIISLLGIIYQEFLQYDLFRGVNKSLPSKTNFGFYPVSYLLLQCVIKVVDIYYSSKSFVWVYYWF